MSFSGIDGAGKSTQIEGLRVRLNEIGLRVLLVSFWNDIAQLTRLRQLSGRVLFKGDEGVGTPERPVNRRDKNVQTPYMTAVRLFLYFVDAISLRAAVRRALKSNAAVVIFDRYIYDELANLALSRGLVRAYLRFMLRFTPQPDISFLLDANPAEARARKPEYPLEFLHTNRASYLALSKLISGMKVVSPQPVPETGRYILHEVLASRAGPSPA